MIYHRYYSTAQQARLVGDSASADKHNETTRTRAGRALPRRYLGRGRRASPRLGISYVLAGAVYPPVPVKDATGLWWSEAREQSFAGLRMAVVVLAGGRVGQPCWRDCRQ